MALDNNIEVTSTRFSKDELINDYKKLQKEYESKTIQSILSKLSSPRGVELCMLHVLNFMMGNDMVHNPYEMQYDIDSQKHVHKKANGKDSLGNTIWEETDEMIPVGKMSAVPYWESLLWGTRKTDKNGQFNDAITRQLNIGGNQIAKAERRILDRALGKNSDTDTQLRHLAQVGKTNIDVAQDNLRITKVIEMWYLATTGDTYQTYSEQSAKSGAKLLEDLDREKLIQSVLNGQNNEVTQKHDADESPESNNV